MKSVEMIAHCVTRVVGEWQVIQFMYHVIALDRFLFIVLMEIKIFIIIM